MVPLKYGTLDHMFHLIIWLFCHVTAIILIYNSVKWCTVSVINLRYNRVKWCIVALFVWVGIWNYLRIYRLPIDPVKKFVALKCFLKR